MENQMSPAVKQIDECESAEVVAVARRRNGVNCYRAQRVMNRVREMRGGKDYDNDFSRRMHGEGIWAGLVRQSFTKTAERLGLLF